MEVTALHQPLNIRRYRRRSRQFTGSAGKADTDKKYPMGASQNVPFHLLNNISTIGRRAGNRGVAEQRHGGKSTADRSVLLVFFRFLL